MQPGVYLRVLISAGVRARDSISELERYAPILAAQGNFLWLNELAAVRWRNAGF
jgi:hypothetical protein